MAETFALGVVFKAPLFLKYRHLDGIAEATPPRWDCRSNTTSTGLPDSAQKTAVSLFELILAHRARQKTWPSLGVGYSPNAANEFTRGGFLECAKQANPLSRWLG